MRRSRASRGCRGPMSSDRPPTSASSARRASSRPGGSRGPHPVLRDDARSRYRFGIQSRRHRCWIRTIRAATTSRTPTVEWTLLASMLRSAPRGDETAIGGRQERGPHLDIDPPHVAERVRPRRPYTSMGAHPAQPLDAQRDDAARKVVRVGPPNALARRLERHDVGRGRGLESARLAVAGGIDGPKDVRQPVELLCARIQEALLVRVGRCLVDLDRGPERVDEHVEACAVRPHAVPPVGSREEARELPHAIVARFEPRRPRPRDVLELHGRRGRARRGRGTRERRNGGGRGDAGRAARDEDEDVDPPQDLPTSPPLQPLRRRRCSSPRKTAHSRMVTEPSAATSAALLCGRLGISRLHSRPHDPEACGKRGRRRASLCGAPRRG